MIDLQLIRKDSESVAAALAKKGAIVSFDELLEWDKERRSLIANVETLKAKRNKVSGEIPLYKKQGKDTTEIFKEMREIGDEISASDAKIGALEEKINDFIARLPNLPDEDVVAGEKENNVVVSKEYLTSSEKVLIVDDFLASGNAALGLLSLVEQAGATAVGFVAAIEKSEQGGRALIEKKGVKVYSLARIKEMRAGDIKFD